MSALALILRARGHAVSGSDPQSNQNIKVLVAKGITFFDSQRKENIKVLCQRKNGSPLVVISTAISNNNPELEAAREASLEIWHRSDLLATLMREQPSIAVAGSHGKTTTSTFITTLLAFADRDPTAIIGGIVPLYERNAHAGKGPLLVAEADESDGTLIKFETKLGLITNLELDHTDHYKDLNEVINTMKIFGKKCTKLLANHDCTVIREHFNAFAWWSIKNTKGVDFAALPISLNSDKTIADFYEKGLRIGEITVPLPGLHNLSNAIAAIAACRLEGLSFQELEPGIANLKAPKRRFDIKGFWEGRQIIDDYAHHPSEINATIEMARLMIKGKNDCLQKQLKRIVVAFQPHRYSRTKRFLDEFAITLGKADCVLLAPIYAAGEPPIKGISSEVLAQKIKILHPSLQIHVANNLNELTKLIKHHSLENDLVLSMGAGDINSLWTRLTENSRPIKWVSSIAA